MSGKQRGQGGSSYLLYYSHLYLASLFGYGLPSYLVNNQNQIENMKILKSFKPSDETQKFYTFEGDAYRNDNLQLVRKDVSKHYREIDSINKLKACLRAGEYTFPGSYRLFFYTDDGSVLSFESVLDNLQSIYYSMMHDIKDGWSIVGMGSVEEIDEDVYCEHSSELIS